MPIDREVAVTGIGVVSACGYEVGEFWTNLRDGRSGIGPLTIVPTERLNCRFAAQVLSFSAEQNLGPRQGQTMDRFAQFAVAAARAALTDSGLDLTAEDADRIPVIVGTGVGGLNTLDDAFLALYGRDAARLHPLTIPRLMVNAAASHISMDLGLRGEAYAVASACASSTHAIGQAFRAIVSNGADIAITGGTEACLTVGTIKAWEAMRVMSDEPCRPFSRDRSGMTLGEGAAILVLEEYGRAKARNAPIYARISGYGASADAADLVAPSAEGPARAMRLALESGGLSPDAVDYVNAHGTGTMVNDLNEARAIREVLGGQADRVMVSSSKAVLGHCLGSAGALEAAATALALHHQTVPPTANHTQPDNQIPLDVVPNVARESRLRVALSNSFAFGGLNAVLAFEAA